MASKNGDQVLVAGEEVTNSNSSEAKQFMKMSEVDGRNATGRERDCPQGTQAKRQGLRGCCSGSQRTKVPTGKEVVSPFQEEWTPGWTVVDSAGGCTYGRGAEKPGPQWTGTPVTPLPAGTARGPWWR